MKLFSTNVNRIVSLLLIVVLLASTLVGCKKKEEPPKGSGMADVSKINDDLPREDDGTVNLDYLEGVELNMWSVIGNPDQETLLALVQQFNNQFAGMIRINVRSVGHNDYYAALDSTYQNDYSNFPDVCFMHNEKNIEYALKGYFYPLDELITKTGVGIDFANAYDNIEKTTLYENNHYGIPIDAHGYLTQIRQDIIKKNGLGFDNNTRFVPESYEEYQTLLEDLRALADSGELWVRHIGAGQNHAWYQLKDGNNNLDSAAVVNANNFYPVFFHSQESDNLTALYVNGGSLLDADGNVSFHKNAGMLQYVSDHAQRYNDRLYGDAGNKEAAFPSGQVVMFSEGPWMVANTYDFWWNNVELSRAGENGVTEEDAADPIYTNPYIASRPYYMASESAPADTASKWYGNGHVITVTNKVTSMQKVAAALVFAEWLTQGQNKDGGYNLTTWCKAGHLPAWQNVYESDDYQAAEANSITLQAMGDPANIIALESTRYASTLIAGLTTAVGNIQSQLLSESGCTPQKAKETLETIGQSTQESINLLKLGFGAN